MTTEQGAMSTGGAGETAQVRDELKHDAQRLKDTAGQRAKQEVETRKGEAVRVAGSASSALQNAAGELENDPDAPQWLSTAMQKAASQIERLAGEIENRSVDDLGREVSRFAREHPAAFLAASAATGFAAARMLRAGADKKHHDQSGGQAGGQQPDSWQSGDATTGHTPVGEQSFGSREADPSGDGSNLETRYAQPEGGTLA